MAAAELGALIPPLLHLLAPTNERTPKIRLILLGCPVNDPWCAFEVREVAVVTPRSISPIDGGAQGEVQ